MYLDGWIPGQTEDIKKPQHQKGILKKIQGINANYYS